MTKINKLKFGRRGTTVGMVAVTLFTFLILIYRFPFPFFSYERQDRGFAVYSDRPISATLDNVIDDSIKRLSTSPLYHGDEKFRIFICNDNWRLKFFAFNGNVGGQTIYLTENIFIREVDIAGNKIISPGPKPLLDPLYRPLSYFIAHEATHVIQERHFGILKIAQTPKWLLEGYADLVAKGGAFDLAGNQQLMRNGDTLLSQEMARNGLYRRFHLMVAALLFNSKGDVEGLFAGPPSEEAAESAAISAKFIPPVK